MGGIEEKRKKKKEKRKKKKEEEKKKKMRCVGGIEDLSLKSFIHHQSEDLGPHKSLEK